MYDADELLGVAHDDGILPPDRRLRPASVRDLAAG
jgi:hypothetical protein